MLSLSDSAALARALTFPLDQRIAALLLLRQEQLGGEFAGHARFVVIEPGDTPSRLEEALGFSVFQNPGDGTWFGDPDFTPGWEWMEDHGFAFEQVWIFDDSGFARVVIVMQAPGVSGPILELCRAYASQDA